MTRKIFNLWSITLCIGLLSINFYILNDMSAT